jgi:hypothetical protein
MHQQVGQALGFGVVVLVGIILQKREALQIGIGVLLLARIAYVRVDFHFLAPGPTMASSSYSPHWIGIQSPAPRP